MALVIKQKYEIGAQSDRQYVTNKTGAYDATENEGGFGAPNPELDQSALVCIVIRKALGGDEQVAPVSSRTFYNPNANNDDEHIFEFFYINDGSHESHLMRLPVSNDGILTLEGVGLNEGDYFYYTVTSSVNVISLGSPVEVDDLSVLIGNENIVQTLCQEYFAGQLSIERQKRYRDYREQRKGPCNEDEKFLNTNLLSQDIQSADYTFRSGLTVEAQAQTETLLDEFNIDNLTNAL